MRLCTILLCLAVVFISSGCVTAADKKLAAEHQKMYAVNRELSEVSLEYAKACEEVAAELYVAEKALYDLDYQDFLESHCNDDGRLVSLDAAGDERPILRKDIVDANSLYQQKLQELSEKRQRFLEVQDEYLERLRQFAAVTETTDATEKMIMESKQSAQAIIQQGLTIGGVVVGAAIAK